MIIILAKFQTSFEYDDTIRRACGRGDVSTPSFGNHLNPILTRGADYAHPILVSTPSFESHRRACSVTKIRTFYKTNFNRLVEMVVQKVEIIVALTICQGQRQPIFSILQPLFLITSIIQMLLLKLCSKKEQQSPYQDRLTYTNIVQAKSLAQIGVCFMQ